MSHHIKREKVSPPGGLYIPLNVVIGIFAYHTILLSISKSIGDGLGRISFSSLFLSLGIILGGGYLGRLSVQGKIVLPIWVIVFVVTLQVIIAISGRAVLA
ncbi:MAG: hypothetical protein Q4E06_06025 [Lautropia sp.]|nr:hypothetical protein [Lautropia sp.]